MDFDDIVTELCSLIPSEDSVQENTEPSTGMVVGNVEPEVPRLINVNGDFPVVHNLWNSSIYTARRVLQITSCKLHNIRYFDDCLHKTVILNNTLRLLEQLSLCNNEVIPDCLNVEFQRVEEAINPIRYDYSGLMEKFLFDGARNGKEQPDEDKAVEPATKRARIAVKG